MNISIPQTNAYGYFDNSIKFLRVLDQMKVDLDSKWRQQIESLKKDVVKMNNKHVLQKKMSIGPHFKVTLSTCLYQETSK